jgi:hypothetical protein
MEKKMTTPKLIVDGLDLLLVNLLIIYIGLEPYKLG